MAALTSSSTAAHQNGGTICAATANAVTRLYKEYTGRGPNNARTVVDGDVVIVMLRDALTTAERRLIADGKVELVEQLRREFHATMSDDLVAAVQMLTERTVIAFLSARNAKPDITAQTFVLLPDSANGSGPAGGRVRTTEGAEVMYR